MDPGSRSGNQVADSYQWEKESNYRGLILLLALLSVILTFVDRVNLAAAAPGMMKEFRWSPAVLGIVLSAFSGTYKGLEKTFG